MPTDQTSQERDQAWSQLMSAAQSGDRIAYERLLREITPLVRALVRRHCSNRADIEEMVQDTLLTLHRVRQTYDPRPAVLPVARGHRLAPQHRCPAPSHAGRQI